MAEEWADWWRKRGDERLSLLLWAVWNPIGPVPLDEYANYTGQVVQLLQQAYDSDEELWPPGTDLTDDLQRKRNKLHADSVTALATLLDDLRCGQIGDTPTPDADRQAAETLLDWYGWEMQSLARRS